jgi:phosphoglycerate dehydrogenase-like enzyme
MILPAEPTHERRRYPPPTDAGTDTGTAVAVVDCEPEDEPRLERLRREAPTRVAFGPPGSDEIVERAAGAAVLVTLYTYTTVDTPVLERLPGLRLVATRTAGYSHVDVGAASARGVAVAAVPGAATQSVAEYTFGALLALQRRLFEAREATRDGRFEYRGFRGFELAGRTLGVVGLGAIGLRVAELAQAFGMCVLAWSRRQAEVPGVELVTLEELLARSDVVSVNVALTDETRGLLGAERLALLKPGAILVNTARGGIVDDEALRRLLEAGRLGGAVLDVLETEPPERDVLVRLASAPNVLVTPHIAFHTDEALSRQFDGMTENVLAFLAGTPRNLVVPAATLAA